MHWPRVLSVLCLLGYSTQVPAAECYALGAYGFGTYHKTHGKFEDQLLSLGASGEYRGHTYSLQVTGGYVINQTSRPYEWGIGCDISRSWAVEASYRRGFQMSIDGHYGLRATLDGKVFETPHLAVRERIEMEGVGLSVLGKYPLSERIALTGRLGVMRGEATLFVAFPQLTSTEFVVLREKGNLPIVGVGVLYRHSRDWAFSWEYVKYNQESNIQNLMVRRYF